MLVIKALVRIYQAHNFYREYLCTINSQKKTFVVKQQNLNENSCYKLTNVYPIKKAQ